MCVYVCVLFSVEVKQPISCSLIGNRLSRRICSCPWICKIKSIGQYTHRHTHTSAHRPHIQRHGSYYYVADTTIFPALKTLAILSTSVTFHSFGNHLGFSHNWNTLFTNSLHFLSQSYPFYFRVCIVWEYCIFTSVHAINKLENNTTIQKNTNPNATLTMVTLYVSVSS